jgi:hypothetical protein
MALRFAMPEASPMPTPGPLVEFGGKDLQPRATAKPGFAVTYYNNGIEGEDR